MSSVPIDARFWLWVDGVGGFLVCPSECVVIGQPVPDDSVDVPILADLSRRHAQVCRQGESYRLEAWRPTRLDGRLVEQPALLRSDSIIELGAGVRLRFRQPHRLSLSARLDLISHHRTQPSTSGVLLAHETLVLGPRAESHVVCPDWTCELVLFKQGEQWHCRLEPIPIPLAGSAPAQPNAPARTIEWQVDGVPAGRRAALTRSSRITGTDFAISFEPWSNAARPAAK